MEEARAAAYELKDVSDEVVKGIDGLANKLDVKRESKISQAYEKRMQANKEADVDFF